MSSEIAEHFAEGVTVREFLLERVPALHARRLERFNRFVKVPLIFSVYLEDTSERFTIKLDARGAETEDDEMIDFPQVTCVALASNWEESRRHMSALYAILDERDDLREPADAAKVLTQAVLDEFERFDGAIAITLTGTEKPGGMTMTLALNDYLADDGAPRFEVSLPMDLVYQVARGELSPEQAGKTIQLRGKKSLALDLAGWANKHFGP